MNYRRLGQTELMVSAIGFGGIPIQRIGAAQSDVLLKKALDNGINFFDTARAYTDSEEKFGRILSKNRQLCIIATKSMARSCAAMAADINMSLKLLKTDCIDIYQLHNVKDADTLKQVLAEDGALSALKQAQQQGKIRHIGITGHIPAILAEAVKTGCFATLQFPYNAIETAGRDLLLPPATDLDIGTIIMKPLAGGSFKQAAPAALKYILNDKVSCAIPGIGSNNDLQSAISIGNLDNFTLSAEEEKSLQAEKSSLSDKFCRRCEYCRPCPEGVDIPSVFLLDGYWTRYNMKDWAQSRYNTMPIKASACRQCGICESKCPYELPIREMLKKSIDHFE